MTLKAKIDALKKAAANPMSRDPMSPFQQFRQKKVEERIDTLFNRGVEPPKNKQEDYHITKFVQKGIKVRPQKPGVKQYNKMVSAQENKEKLRQMFAEEEEHPVDQFKKLNKKDLDYKKGFSYDPRKKKLISNDEARKEYGKEGVSMHYIPVTDNPGDVENLRKKWDEIHSSREAKERPPHFIGGWHRDKTNEDLTDISYILNTNDREEVQGHLEKTNQESTYTVHPSGEVEYIKNKKYVAPKKEAQEINPDLIRPPLQIVFQGRLQTHMGKLDVGTLNYDEVDPIKDLNSISLILINGSENELTKFALETNIPKDGYKVSFPYKIAANEKAMATLFLMGSKINAMPKGQPLRLKFTYKEKEI